MKRIASIIFLLFGFGAIAQDSSKVMKHELGFNTIGLIKQVISNNPNSTLAQLPYQIIYNYNLNSKVSIRLGVGMNIANSTTKLDGQNEPRISNSTSLNSRLGAGYNFLSAGKFTFNFFGDALFSTFNSKTVNTSTSTSFVPPSTTQTITTTTTTSDQLTGVGGEVGFSIKFNITKHLSLYTETPLQVISSKTKSKVGVVKTSNITQTDEKSENVFTELNAKIFLPTTIFLILRF